MAWVDGFHCITYFLDKFDSVTENKFVQQWSYLPNSNLIYGNSNLIYGIKMYSQTSSVMMKLNLKIGLTIVISWIFTLFSPVFVSNLSSWNNINCYLNQHGEN